MCSTQVIVVCYHSYHDDQWSLTYQSRVPAMVAIGNHLVSFNYVAMALARVYNNNYYY